MASKSATLVQEEARAESAVRKGYALATFVKPIPEREKDHPFLTFEISFPLTDEHKKDGVLPDEIKDAWQAIVTHGLRTGTVMTVDPHDVILRIVPDSNVGELSIPRAVIEKAAISIVEEKGTGEAREVIRLQLRIKTDLEAEAWRWAGQHFGHPIWIRLRQAQGSLLK